MQRSVYLNTASCGLLSEESLAPATELHRQMISNASAAVEPLRDTGIERIRQTVSAFIDAPATQVALIPNFSWGLNAIVKSLSGDERVLLYRRDYPSLLAPFTINHFAITWIGDEDGYHIDFDKLKHTLIAEQIQVVALSHVQWLTGFKIDLAALSAFCREKGIRLIVDTTQSLGAELISIRDCELDVMICSNYKWMNAGFGTGILYVSADFMNSYPPTVGGSNSYILDKGSSIYEPSIKNFEPGHYNVHGLLILEQAIAQKSEMGLKAIAQHNQELVRKVAKAVDPALLYSAYSATEAGSILTIKDGRGLHDHLIKNGIVCIQREGNIRIGFHFYNTEEEADYLISLLQNY